MPTLREAIYNLLTNDGELMTLLAGGIHTATEISRQNTPTAFDRNNEVLPCALLKFEALVYSRQFKHSSMETFILALYQRSSYDTIEQARQRCYKLLHRQKPAVGIWEVVHNGDVLDQQDGALDCSLIVSRYGAMVQRLEE